ncbi:MAG: histone acetyltransferase [Halobacterium sp.]
MTRRLPIAAVRPTQLYLSSEKVADAAAWFDFDDPDYDPLPVFEYDGDWYLSDGHTRAFLAHLAGVDGLRVERDDGLREEYDFGVYEAAIEWCDEGDVTEIADLVGRVVEPDTFEEVWIARCQQVGEE